MKADRALNVDDLRIMARRRLPRAVFDIIDGGAGDELTLQANRHAFANLWLRPRAFVDVSEVDLTTVVLGERVSMPLLLAPCGFPRMCNSQAEFAVARAASRAGTIYAVPNDVRDHSGLVAAETSGPLWHQFFLEPDHESNERSLDHVEAAGYRVLCLTVDTPVMPRHERNLRNKVSLVARPSARLLGTALSRPRWTFDFAFRGSPGTRPGLLAGKRALEQFAGVAGKFKPPTMGDLRWLRRRWKGPLVVKGMMQPAQVGAVIDEGVDGIIVSNHGGRNLDGSEPTIAALPRIVEAANDRVEVFMDGGIRRGTDVVKAVALGARAVLIGRAYMYALAAGGESGVDHVLNLLHDEIRAAVGFLGATSITGIDSSMVGIGMPGSSSATGG